jgi:hypothetical protein
MHVLPQALPVEHVLQQPLRHESTGAIGRLFVVLYTVLASQAQPGPTWQVLSAEMQELPQALPTLHVIQQPPASWHSGSGSVVSTAATVGVAVGRAVGAAVGAGVAPQPEQHCAPSLPVEVHEV